MALTSWVERRWKKPCPSSVAPRGFSRAWFRAGLQPQTIFLGGSIRYGPRGLREAGCTVQHQAMNKWFVIGGLLLVVSWFPFLFREWSREDPHDAEDAAAKTVDDGAFEPNRPVAVLPKALKPAPLAEEEAPRAPSDVAAPSTSEGVENAPEQDEPVHDGSDEEPVPASAEPYVKQLKAAFESETRDSLWAKPREEALRAQVEQRGVRLSGDDPIRCQRTVCRVGLEVTKDETSRMQGFYVSLLMDRPPAQVPDEQAPPNEQAPAEPESAQQAAVPDRVFGLETLSSDPESTQIFLYVSRAGYSFSP